MKADKITTTITVETLSKDCVVTMLEKVRGALWNECRNGTLISDDGDTVTWSTKSKPVEF